MRAMDRFRWLLAMSLAACCFSTSTATEADEIALNQVRVLFYEATLGAWQSHNMSATFRSTVAATCTVVCNTDLAICGLGASATFTAPDVVIVSEEQIPGYLAVVYYISYPAGVTLTSPNVTEFILNKDSAADAVINGREAIYLSLGYEIVEVDNELYPKKIDWTMNYIMIPVTVLVVLLVVGICLLLQFRAYGCKSKYNQIKPTRPEIVNRDAIQNPDSNAAHKTDIIPKPETINSQVKPDNDNSNKNSSPNNSSSPKKNSLPKKNSSPNHVKT